MVGELVLPVLDAAIRRPEVSSCRIKVRILVATVLEYEPLVRRLGKHTVALPASFFCSVKRQESWYCRYLTQPSAVLKWVDAELGFRF